MPLIHCPSRCHRMPAARCVAGKFRYPLAADMKLSRFTFRGEFIVLN
nr:MAG TPA: hypothetical protein [Caudoviricetes sp.]